MDSKETVGSSRKKIKYVDEELLLDSSDNEFTFNTEESEGYRFMDVKNLSKAISNAHVCEKGNLTFEEDKSARAGLMSVFLMSVSTLWYGYGVLNISTIVLK